MSAPRFAQRHYEAIAEVLNRTSPYGPDWPESMTMSIMTRSMWRSVVYALANDFAKDSPRFNRTKFYTACGVQS